ncbi:hypothetical protein SOCE26_076540 [Sorangium cellulosum]|uniref:Secreted protein n=1 Tax=Sorangium cellulosum TaxID=56 RepID=A0A2L0F3X4_SORCE|nr:hypothetical protein [Sorangium cellulosum]AUX46149.1 hypothetical protein SOCE26_076540 [Sorangium cellulosum]
MQCIHDSSRERSIASALAATLLIALAGCSDPALGAPVPDAPATGPAAPAPRWERAPREARPGTATIERDALLREAGRLAEIRAILARSPEAPLSLLDEHRTEFPAGALAAEREVIAIDALLRRGSGGDARARAQDFLARFPSSPHAERVRRVARATP